MKAFLTIWFGQLTTRVGTALTRFALLVWLYEQAAPQGGGSLGAATAMALLGFFAFAPQLLISPFAGVWVDRLDRRTIMIGADLAAGLLTLALCLLHIHGDLAIWHLYLASFLAGAFETFQAPAYTALSTVLLPKEQYGRASGLRAMAENGAQVLAPFLAGVLMMWQGLTLVMLVDMATVVVALLTLWRVRTPQTPAGAGDAALPGRFWQEVGFGFRYLWQRPGLAGMTLIFTAMNFIATLTYFSILSTMILARSDGDEFALAGVQAMLGAAGVLGAIAMSIWGGPRRRIHGVLIGAALSFLLGDMMLGVGRSLPVWLAGAFFAVFFIPIIGGSNDAIWQRKVAPAYQGRVFAVKNMVGQALVPLGYVLAGLLADRWFEPAMTPGGALAGQFAWLVGTGPGAGMALMFVCTSIIGVVVCLSGYAFRAIRDVEEDLAGNSMPSSVAISSQPA